MIVSSKPRPALATIAALCLAGTSTVAVGGAPTPPRPQLPAPLPEEVWQALEASPAYRAALPVPWTRLRVASQTATQVRDGATTLANDSSVTTIEPIGEKCLLRTTVETMAPPLAVETTSRHYACAGIELMGVDTRGQVVGQLQSVRVAEAPGRAQLGALFGVDYSYRKKGWANDTVVTERCRVVAALAAAELHPQLDGKAWKLACDADSDGPYTDYFIEKMGLRASAFNFANEARRSYIIPSAGQQAALDQVSQATPKWRFTTTYTDTSIAVQSYRFGAIGAYVMDLPATHSYALGGARHGAVVHGVAEEAPAALVGLKAGDVIVRIDKSAVADRNAFIEKIQALAPGQRAQLNIWRAGVRFDVMVAADD